MLCPFTSCSVPIWRIWTGVEVPDADSARDSTEGRDVEVLELQAESVEHDVRDIRNVELEAGIEDEPDLEIVDRSEDAG